MAGENPDFTLPGSLGPSGTEFIIMAQVTSSAIRDGASSLRDAITGAAVGTVKLKDINIQTDGTGLAGPTALEFTTDNAKGISGVANNNIVEALGFGANATWNALKDGDTVNLPMFIEAGKKLYIQGSDAAGSGAGVINIHMTFQRLTAGAYIQKADVS